MSKKVRCPRCGKRVDPRGCSGHMRSHGVEHATSESFVQLDETERQKLLRELE